MQWEVQRHDGTEYQTFLKCRFRAFQHHMSGRFHFQISALPTHFNRQHNLLMLGGGCLQGEEEQQFHAVLRARVLLPEALTLTLFSQRVVVCP